MKREDLRGIKQLLRAVKGRIAGLVRRGTIVASTGTSGYQSANVTTSAGDVDDMVEVFEQYGFTGAAPPGSEAIILAVGGHREHRVALAPSLRAGRPKDLAPGEVAVYHINENRLIFRTDLSVVLETAQGASIEITPTGTINITPTPTQTVNIGTGGPGIARVGDAIQGTAPDIVAIDAAITTFLAAPPAPDGGVALATAIQAAIVNNGDVEGAITEGSIVGTCE